jgi:uncharacterized delta-60 repeat protein
MKKLLQLGIIVFGINVYSQTAGSLDTSFGTGGKVVTSINTGSDKANGISLQSDGKIVVAGVTTSASTGKDFVCVRYNSDGTLDATFGTGGIVTTDVQTGSDDVAYSLAIQSDGKIVLGGYSDDGSQKKAALIRYNSNGTIDTTFGTSGKTLTPFELTQASEIKIIKIHALTGNIVVGGNTVVVTNKAKPVIARYTSTGILDTTFNTTGIRLLWIDSLDSQYLMTVEDLVVQTNGKISAIGWRDFPTMTFSNDNWACRVNSNGTMDTTFSTDGVNKYNGSFNGNDRAFSMLLKADNTFVVGGSSDVSAQNYAYAMFEIAPTGLLGSSTNQISIPFSALDKSYPYGLGEDINGKYVLVGSTGSTTNRTFSIARVNANYTIDTTFDTDGKVTTTFGANALNEAFDMAIQTDNKIIAVGYSGNDFAIARYNGTTNLSIDDYEINKSLAVFPNPVKNNLQINLLDKTLIDNTYSILDLNGRIILKGNLSNEFNQVNLENLSKGFYILKVNNLIKKFIKE